MSIKCTITELYDEYCNFVSRKCECKPETKINFNRKLSELGFIYYKSNSINKYKISFIQLYDVAQKYNWINDLDEFIQCDEDEDVKEPCIGLTFGQDTDSEYSDITDTSLLTLMKCNTGDINNYKTKKVFK